MVDVVDHMFDDVVERVFRRVCIMLKRYGFMIVTTAYTVDFEQAVAFCPAFETLFLRWQHVRAFTTGTLAAFMAQQSFVCEWQRAVDFSLNRFMVEELNVMNSEIDRLHARIAQSFCERIKRFFGGTTEHRRRYPNVSLEELPSNIVYVGRPA